MRPIKYILAVLILVSSAFAQFTINGQGVITGLGGLGTSIGVVNCPSITQSGALSNATQGVAYNTTITGSGGTLPYTWSLVAGSLPAGLIATQSGNTFVISGTPTTVQSAAFTVQLRDTSTCSAVTSSLSLTVVASNTLTLQAATLPSVATGAVYPTSVVLATGGSTPYASCAITSGALPGGLSVAVTNTAPKGCQISGTVTGGASPYTFTVQITDNTAHTASRSYSITVICSTCGAPTEYSARTDTSEVLSFLGRFGDPVPTLWQTAPSVNHSLGMNVIATDSLDFNMRYVRATDKTVCIGGSLAMSGPSGGDAQWWSVDSGMFLVQNSGSRQCLMYLNTSTVQVTPSQLSTNGPANGSTTAFAQNSELVMSSLQNNIIYERVGTKINKLIIDRGGPFGGTDTISRSQLIDLASGAGCLAIGYTATWQGTFDISSDDQTFTMAMSNTGGQGSGVDIVSYTIGKGCRHYVTANSLTGPKITGDWGCSYPVGVNACSGPANAAAIVTDDPTLCPTTNPCAIGDQYQLHGVDGLPNGAFAHISGSVNPGCINGATCSCVNGGGTRIPCDPYFWEVGTNMVRPCLVCSGHQAKGYVYEYKGKFYSELDYSHPNDSSGQANPGTRILGFSYVSDQHGSYNNTNSTDSQPVFLAADNLGGANLEGNGRPNSPPYSTFGIAEIVAASKKSLTGSALGCTASTPCLYRFGHNYNSGLSSIFVAANAIGVVSQDGKYLMVTTDWMGNFGSGSGASSCNFVGGNSWTASHPYLLNDELESATTARWQVTTAGTSGTTIPAQLRAPNWVKSHTYALNSYIIPTTNNAGLNVFKATAITTGTVASTAPVWDTACSTTCTDGGVTWTNQGNTVTDTTGVVYTNIGFFDCRADVVILDLLSAH